MSGEAPVVLSVDLGKTSCRLRVTEGQVLLAETDGIGAPGLAEPGGATVSAAALVETLGGIPGDVRARIQRIGIGAAGAEAAPDTALSAFVDAIRRELDASVALTSDAFSAHAGAFGGGHGTMLIAGTGAVVISTDDGGVRRVDGWGPWLGDDGSGRWIGQSGLQAALRSADGRGPRTALEDDAKAFSGSVAALPGWVSEGGQPARRLASFAPVVIDRAEQGDDVSLSIASEAAALLASSCAVIEPATVCVLGGLASHPFFTSLLDSALHTVGIERVAPLGDALDGARLITVDDTIHYDGKVLRDHLPA